MKKILSLILVICICFGLISCGSSANENNTADAPESTENTTAAEKKIPAEIKLIESDALKGKKIGCSICYKGDIWCSVLADALEILADHYGAELICEDGDSKDENQKNQLNKMLADKCDAVFFDPVSPTGCNEELKKITDAGIPLMLFDEFWQDANDGVITTVTWDQYRSGVDLGNYFLEYLKKNNIASADVIELTSNASPHFAERFQGFHDTVSASSDIKFNVVESFNTEGSREAAEKFVSEFTAPYNFVITDIDPSALGAVSALRKAENTDVKVFTLGGYGDDSFNTVHDNDANYIAFIDVDPWELASKMFENLIKYFNGDKLDDVVYIDHIIIDNSNCEDFWKFD